MAKSSVGKARIRLYAALMICNIIVFALSAHVNSFHGFFYVADQMPFAMSIITFMVVGLTLLGDMKAANPFLSRPSVELPWLAVLSLFWLCFNAFSSSRWRFIQGADCGSIPEGQDFSAVAVWCKETQALRSFVWIEWVILVLTFLWLTRYTVTESSRGNKRVWSTSLARSTQQSYPQMKYINRPSAAFSSGRASSFMSGDRDSDPSIYTPQSLGPDFERQSQEHWQNTQHAHSASVQSYNSYNSYQNHPYQQQQQQQYHSQQSQSQPQQYQQSNLQPGQYMFNGYGHAH